MQNNTIKADSARPRPNSVRFFDEVKQIRKAHTRKIPYRVGYSWNKGGRLKELRIRHLARKFLKIWMHNTFGRILPHKAKLHYESVVLTRAFAGLRDVWWSSRKEWSLTLRAECHYRYYLCNVAFHGWRKFVSLQREKKSKIQTAQSFADRQRMRLVWDRWEVFILMKRMKNRMLQSSLELNRLSVLHSAWRLWQIRLQQYQHFHALEDQALRQRKQTLLSRTWQQWKQMHFAACCQKERETKAVFHFNLKLKRRTLHCWKSYVSHLQTKKELQAVAQRAYCLHLVRMCWSKWSRALCRKWSDADRLEAAKVLAVQATQRRTLEQWKAYVTACREEHDRNSVANQYHRHHLLHIGLQGLSLNVVWSKTYRMNKNMAVQHYLQTLISRYWKLWQCRLEEAEDKSFQPQREMAVTKHRKLLLSSCFHNWRKKLAEHRHMEDLERRANIWFAECTLPQCFNSWVDFMQQERLQEQRQLKAEVYSRQRQYTWVFYTWWARTQQHKEQMLSERMAILHEERCCLQRALERWRQRTEQQICEKEKQEASDNLYRHRLLHKTMTQWKENNAEIRDRRNREQQACHRGDLRLMRWALEKWKQFVQMQQLKKNKLKQMQHHHEVKLLSRTFVAWKGYYLQKSQIYSHAEELCKQREQNLLRDTMFVWKENAELLKEVRLMQQRAHSHFQHLLLHKVFLSWRKVTIQAVSTRRQQEEAVTRAQRSICQGEGLEASFYSPVAQTKQSQVRLLRLFQRWRKRTREARRERISKEKARRHHDSKLLSKAMKAWSEHHNQHQKNKVMKRKGFFLVRLKMYQTYFELWKVKLQHRRREAEQTERALWHWSLTLQAKVLYGWRLQVTEQRRKQEREARAAQVYRDQLLKEGVTCILTYAAHMNDLTTNLTERSQEQRSRRVQRAVKRCAMRWKQRALCKPRREEKVKGQQPKKSVTFCLTAPDSDEQEDAAEELRTLLLSRASRRQPRRRSEELLEFPLQPNSSQESEAAPHHSPLNYPPQDGCSAALFFPRPAEVIVTSTHHSVITPDVSPFVPHMSTVDDVLLPPSAFMSRAEEKMEKTSSSELDSALLVPPSKTHSSADPNEPPRASSGETAAPDPASSLVEELLCIQVDMKTYQQDRKQLKAWQKLREVLQSWLQTSGKDEEMERNAVCQELKELEERVHRLSTELAERKPTMLLHVERIKHLQDVLTSRSVFTFSREIALAQSCSDTC